jgi:hypothetical protein
MNSLKESVELVIRSLRRFLSLSFVFASMILIVRLHDLIFTNSFLYYPTGTTINILIGLKFDLIFYLQISAILLFPFLCIAFFSQKAAKYFFISAAVILTLGQIFLLKYFSITKIPFSTTLTNYSLSEFLQIFSFSNRIPYFSYLVLIIYLVYMIRIFIKHVYLKLKPWAMFVLTLLLLGSVLFSKKLEPKRSEFKNEFAYYVATNKLHYFALSLPDYYYLERK